MILENSAYNAVASTNKNSAERLHDAQLACHNRYLHLVETMVNSTMKQLNIILSVAAAAALAAANVLAHEEEKHEGASSEESTVTGEVVDMVCYIDEGSSGAEHAECAKTCIKMGLPVGIKSEGKTYLLVGEHKPMNEELAPLAAKTVTVKGKVVSRDGFNMIENAEIVKR